MLSRHEEQNERRQVLANDLRVRGSTFAQFAQADADTNRGRFTSYERSAVVGSTPLPKYEGAPNWAPDPTGIEPPTGVDINEHPPVGEAYEVRASIAEHRGSLGPSIFASAKATPNPASSPGALKTPPPLVERHAGLGSFSSRIHRRF